MKDYFVYLLASRSGVLYTGVTNNLMARVYQHKTGRGLSFTSKYNVHLLVYYETTSDVRSAIVREKEIKGWTRAKKVALIEATNPGWNDLSADWYDQSTRVGEAPGRMDNLS